MAKLHQLRKELRFNLEFLQLIQTLKNIAAAQYHMLEHEKQRFEEFMNAFGGFFHVVNLVGVDDPLVREMSDVVGIVAVTSDSGFMGGLNAGVVETALGVQGALPDDRVELVVVGEKGAGKFQELRRRYKFFEGIGEQTLYDRAVELGDYLVGRVLDRQIGRVVVVYPRPLSFTQQLVEVVDLLPCGRLFESAPGAGADPAAPERERRVVVESTFTDMVEYLSSVWTVSKLYEMFEDSKLAEYAARAMHLEDSAQKLDKEVKKVRHQCFRAAHEVVDKGMRESFSSRRRTRRRVAA
jgi:ATP synthase F1 gamma subunit